MTKHVEDPEYLEQILKKHKCPYCEYSLKHTQIKRKCQRCDFTLYGNPQLVAYKTDEEPIEYTYPIDKCIECQTPLYYEDKEKELVCPHCGLVHTSQHQYVGHHRINYPFGLHTDGNFFI